MAEKHGIIMEEELCINHIWMVGPEEDIMLIALWVLESEVGLLV